MNPRGDSVLHSFGLLAVAAIAATAGAQSDPVRALDESRKQLKPFYATYLEVNKVSGQLAPSDASAGWGSSDSKLNVESAVDAICSSLIYQDMNGKPKDASTALAGGGQQIYFNDGKTNYDLIEGGRRGGFGSHPSGMVNPAAASYEFNGVPARDYFKKHQYVVDGPEQVSVSYRSTATTVQFNTFGSQTVLASAHTTNQNGEVDVTVQSWIDHRGQKYPKAVDLKIYHHGQLSTERTWTLLKIHEDRTGVLQTHIPEGALIKDYDSNIVYNLKGGKLVPNPFFNREVASSTTLRRFGFIFAVVILIAWILYRLKGRMSKRATSTL